MGAKKIDEENKILFAQINQSSSQESASIKKNNTSMESPNTIAQNNMPLGKELSATATKIKSFSEKLRRKVAFSVSEIGWRIYR